MSHTRTLTKREQQIMDALYRAGSASAREIQDQLPDPPSNATVRKLLALMEEKGLIQHHKQGRSFIYSPARSAEEESKAAIGKTVSTFFKDSPPRAFAALLDVTRDTLTEDDLEELQALIDDARTQEKDNE